MGLSNYAKTLSIFKVTNGGWCKEKTKITPRLSWFLTIYYWMSKWTENKKGIIFYLQILVSSFSTWICTQGWRALPLLVPLGVNFSKPSQTRVLSDLSSQWLFYSTNFKRYLSLSLSRTGFFSFTGTIILCFSRVFLSK